MKIKQIIELNYEKNTLKWQITFSNRQNWASRL